MANAVVKETENFAERLKSLRLQKRLSQAQLADKIGVHHTHIGRYERDESKPLSKHLRTLADALEVSTDYLLNGTEEDAAITNFKDREFLEIFKEAEQLNEEQKEFVKKVVSALLNDFRLQKQYAS